MAEIKVDINAEDINKAVVDAIINSTIGANIRKQIEEKVKSIGYDPIKTQLNYLISQTVRDLIETDYKEKIRESIKKHLTDEIIDNMAKNLIDKYR